MVLLHPGVAQPALHLQGCDQVLLETVTFHSAPGAAVFLEGCRDISFDTLRVVPHPGRPISTTGSGVEVIDCTGTVTAQHAVLHGTAGAGLRVQQAYWALTELLDRQTAMVES